MGNVVIFAFASLLPAGVILLACGLGGFWAVAAVLCMTVFVFVLDRRSADQWVRPREASGHVLCYLLGGMHFVVLGACVYASAQAAYPGRMDWILILIAAGLWFGQVSNSNAHELIHRSNRRAHALGVLIYCSLLIGHHASAHLKVHHIHVATDGDPNSARLGEGFYRFFWRALRGSFRAGLRAEKAALRKAGREDSFWQTPYRRYLCWTLCIVSAVLLLAGGRGVLALCVLAGYAQVQLYLSDYVQHYGLRRGLDGRGRVVPVGGQHSWNAPHWYSSAMMLNAPRHSDHHLHPMRHFPALELQGAHMPVLPYSLPVMACLALLPGLWRRVMDPLVQERDQERD